MGGGRLAGLQLDGPDAAYALLRLPEPVDGRAEAAFPTGNATKDPLAPGTVELPAGATPSVCSGRRRRPSRCTSRGWTGRVEQRVAAGPSQTAADPGTTTAAGAQGVWGVPPGPAAYSAAACYGQEPPDGAFVVSSSGLARVALLVQEVPAGRQYPGAYGQTTGPVPASGFAVH